MDKKTQVKIIDNCRAKNLSLSCELKKKGFSYDDLVYLEDSSPTIALPESYETIDTLPSFNDGIPSVSFFSGAGGLDIGFKKAGFAAVAAIEFEPLFCQTLRLNNPDLTVLGPPTSTGNVKNHEEIAEALRALGVHQGFEGVFHGGPPCQPFSIAANQRFNKDGENFKRKGFEDPEKGNLLFDYLWYIEEFLPRAFLIENVAGLLEMDPENRIAEALDHLRTIGYSITQPTILNAADYGVPQNRMRCIILGFLGDRLPVFPQKNNVQTPCEVVLNMPLQGVKNHITREHNAESIERYMRLHVGERDHLGRVDRLDPNKPSKTVIAGGTKGGGRSHLHPLIPRTLSVRESARLQTFPDTYEFVGPVARQFTQVGNAVPPLLAYKLALALKECMLAR